jgi:phage shock protein C
MKRLYRSRKDRMLGGVCGGLGEYSNIDPTVIRLVWAVVSLLTIGTGVLVYIIAWILIPEEPGEAAVHPAGGE